MDGHNAKRAVIRLKSVLSLTAISLVSLAGFCYQVQFSTTRAEDPKMSVGSRGSSVLVDTTLLNVRDAKRAITGRNLRVRGTPINADGNNGTLQLTAKDGTITVSGLHYPAEIGHLMEEGFQVHIEIEGGIKRRKVNNELTFYASEIRRITWEARDDSGTVVQKGERKGIQ